MPVLLVVPVTLLAYAPLHVPLTVAPATARPFASTIEMVAVAAVLPFGLRLLVTVMLLIRTAAVGLAVSVAVDVAPTVPAGVVGVEVGCVVGEVVGVAVVEVAIPAL